MKAWGCLLFSVVMFFSSGCSAPDSVGSSNVPADKDKERTRLLEAEKANLEAEITRLRAENSALKRTPTVLLSMIDASIKSSDGAGAESTLSELKSRYSAAPEVVVAEKLIASWKNKMAAAAKEAERIKSLGFKAIKPSPAISTDKLSLTASAITIGDTWRQDEHDDEYMYQQATRGERFVLIRASVKSKDHDPWLPGIGIYVPKGGSLERVATMRYMLSRWQSYGTYIGLYHDFQNDFQTSSTVSFSLGASVDEEVLRGPVFVIATAEGCHERHTENLQRPPVRYMQQSCMSLMQSLPVAVVTTPAYSVLKIFNANKL